MEIPARTAPGYTHDSSGREQYETVLMPRSQHPVAKRDRLEQGWGSETGQPIFCFHMIKYNDSQERVEHKQIYLLSQEIKRATLNPPCLYSHGLRSGNLRHFTRDWAAFAFHQHDEGRWVGGAVGRMCQASIIAAAREYHECSTRIPRRLCVCVNLGLTESMF